MTKQLYYDVVIVGCGVSGLYTALHLSAKKNILMICKKSMEECDSMLAQGGICVMRDENDYDDFFEDTMRAGHYENRKESVDVMIRSSRGVINELLALGVDFEKNPDGSLKYTKEGAHSKSRICFHNDTTGKEKTWKNALISDDEMAADLQECLASYFLKGLSYDFKYRGDPRIDANDLFYLQRREEERILIRAYETQLTYNGAWSGKIKARRKR